MNTEDCQDVNVERHLNVLLDVIKEAGHAIYTLQKGEFEINTKKGRELVTDADLLANKILKTELQCQFPDIGWLSEECMDNCDRLNRKRIWVVDPIDGTIEFSKRIPEYAISVALIENHLPIMAAVYNPASDELFHAIKGKGAYLNQKRISCKANEAVPFTLLASRSEEARGEWDKFKVANDIKIVGSIAYKLAKVAEGFADATFSLGPKNEWDIAAGTLLVEEAGGIVRDKQQRCIKFNSEKVLVDSIVATSALCHAAIFEMIHS